MDHRSRINKYLNRELSDEEKQSLEEELLSNPELLAEMDFQRFIARNIAEKDEDHFRKKLSGVYLKYQKKKESTRKRKRQLWISGSLVSAVLIFLAMFFLFSEQEPVSGEELFRNYYKPFDQNITSRSTSGAFDKVELFQGVNEYLKGNYRSALTRLNSYILNTGETDPYALFYRGLSSLELGDYNSACSDLERFLEGDSYYLQEHAEWYLLLTYLMLKDAEKARELSGKLEGESHFYAKNIQELRKSLSSISR